MFGGSSSTEYEDIVSEWLHTIFPEHRLIASNRCADKTTDENLTSENWELILNLCDKVQDEKQPGYVAGRQLIGNISTDCIV